jgi:hypothetical protein
MSANDTVPPGAPLQLNSGDLFPPIKLCLLGVASPYPNADDVSVNTTGVGVGVGVGISVGVGAVVVFAGVVVCTTADVVVVVPAPPHAASIKIDINIIARTIYHSSPISPSISVNQLSYKVIVK